jgi:hypothetical protein
VLGGAAQYEKGIAATVAGTTGASRDAGIRTTAYVVKHAESALATAAADGIMDMRATDGTYEFWFYQGTDSQLGRSETFSGTGQPVTDYGAVVTKKVGVTKKASVATSVSYSTKTWWREPGLEPPYFLTVTTSCTHPVDTYQPAVVLSAEIRGLLACGDLTDQGTQYVDGVDAIKLVGSVRTVVAKRSVTATATVWVDPASYLPVRWALSRGRVSLLDYDYRWLPPSSANLAQLTVPIPAGFRQFPRRANDLAGDNDLVRNRTIAG